MGKVVSGGQSLEIVARVATQVNWEELDGDKLQKEVISLSREEFGTRFTAFLRNGGRIFVSHPRLISTRPFNPEEFLGNGRSIWKGSADGDGLSGKEDIDERSSALSEIDPTQILFEICLKRGENLVLGEEKLRRLKKMPERIRLGGSDFLGLWENYQADKENSGLEWLYQNQGITYLDFFGTILRAPFGSRCILCLYRDDGGGWRWSYDWLDDDWNTDGPSAVLASAQT